MASATNAAAISFPTPTGTWLRPTHFAVTSGTNVNFAAVQPPAAVRGSLSTVAAPAANDTVEFAAGQLTITMTGDEITETGWRALLEVLNNSQIRGHVSLHTGTPTATNELDGGGYARVSLGSSPWTVT